VGCAYVSGVAAGVEGVNTVRSMRILYLIPSLAVGGAEAQLVGLANGMAERGHEVAVAVHYSGGELEDRLDNVRLIQLHKAGRWDFPGFSIRLVRAVHSFGPDVICSFLGTPNILTAILKSFLRPARIVWSVRSSDMDLSRYGRAARFGAWLEVRLSKLADGIMVNSRAGKRHALARGMTGDAMAVVSNGFDVDRFTPDPEAGRKLRREWRIPENALLVGLVARLDPMKDHKTFLEAARAAAEQDSALHFVCVGDGPLRDELVGFSEGLSFGDRLVWAGARSDMPAVYSALDMCCLSSITEGFPNVLGEAMACGVPCVTTDVGDASFLVGDSGLVVPPRDFQALAGGIQEMAARVRSKKSGDPRTRIVEHFSLSRMVESVEFLLNKVPV